MDSTDWPHVVIIGGGFGGLYAVKALQRLPVRVTLVDRRNFHLFQPLLYQVAAGGLSAGDIAHPLRAVFANAPCISVIMGEVADIAGPAHAPAAGRRVDPRHGRHRHRGWAPLFRTR